ncbi:unnamed protein product [Sphagnum jensenii]
MFARKVAVNESEEEHQYSSTSKKLENKLIAYSTSLVPDLERELEKYKRLYDDALFALKDRDAEAKELTKNSSVTYKALLVVLQRLSETCLKLARYGSIPVLQTDNIYVLDYNPT